MPTPPGVEMGCDEPASAEESLHETSKPEPDSFEAKMARLRARSEQAQVNADRRREEEANRPKQLDLWPDAVRAVPNAVLRGALFTINNDRAFVTKRTMISSVGGIDVRFKGERFNQTDLDVWESLIHLARKQSLGAKVYFSAHSLLQMLDRHTGKAQHEQLKEDITRLTSGVVEITSEQEGRTFGGSLIQSYYRDEEEEMYVIEISPQLLKLYQDGNTYIDWAERQSLGRANLAKWLHGFYSTHANPLPYKVATLQELTGAKEGRLGDFRKLLVKALDLLVKKTPSFVGWHIDEHDRLHVQRRASKSQNRHLQKRAL